jgi:hypothetical protein
VGAAVLRLIYSLFVLDGLDDTLTGGEEAGDHTCNLPTIEARPEQVA